jgi:hypothetical protein
MWRSNRKAQVLEYPRCGAGEVHWPLTAHRHTHHQVDAKRSGDLGLLALPRAPRANWFGRQHCSLLLSEMFALIVAYSGTPPIFP